MINIRPLQGACWLDRAPDSAVLYGTIRETMETNYTTKGILYHYHLLRSMINWGEIFLYLEGQLQRDDLCFTTYSDGKTHFLIWS